MNYLSERGGTGGGGGVRVGELESVRESVRVRILLLCVGFGGDSGVSWGSVFLGVFLVCQT